MTNKQDAYLLYLTAKTTATRPSDLIGIVDRWTALQFDNAICFIGLSIESAAEEMEEIDTSDGKSFRKKYTMKQLLDPEFRISSEDSWGIENSGDINISVVGGIDGIIYDEV